jgi:hypothetical protein
MAETRAITSASPWIIALAWFVGALVVRTVIATQLGVL